MALATLSPGFQVVAFKLQEAAMMHSDVASRLRDAVNDAHRGTGSYGDYVDHNGDGSSGDCVYSCNGDMRSAPYEIADRGGKAVANIDMANSKNVVPVTTWQEEADDDDEYSAMEEAGLYTKGALPLCERFISKSERSSMNSEDFAGKGKSFPINSPGDISAAVHSMGRAGPSNLSSNSLKSRIIAIAKRKGWTKYLPKAWQSDTSSSESAVTAGGSLRLFESAATLEAIVLKEAKADYEIKLIAPGEGSSAFYPAEVLKRDGPKVFKAGTHVYLNHPTAAEESARPEGDVKNLAGVLSSDAVYNESHAKGPGLYGRMKVFADHAQTVEEKAPHVGMSIRASGIAESGTKKNGKPVLKELTSAESVDVVTRAGAGGMILTESAATNPQEVEMTETEVKKLIESAVKVATAPLEARALRGDAMLAASQIIGPMSLHEAAKARVLDVVTREGAIPMKDGKLDADAFRTLVVAEAQREGEYLSRITGGGRVIGMGSGVPVHQMTEADQEKERKRLKEARKAEKRERETEFNVFADLMGDKTAAANAVGKEVA